MRGKVQKMEIIKYFMLFFILIASSLIGRFLSKKYVYRLQELEEMKNALNLFKTKIKFTYEPIPEIFTQISEMSNKNIGNIFFKAKENMKTESAAISWEKAIEETTTNLKPKDKNILKNLSKLLGQTDSEGQLSQIEITQNFLDAQIKEARRRKKKK